ncbi:MAG: hypothetical protein A3B70_00860 [Deltaproteobacteria bacterium RIFCSPHIGHO2_02_FULL_40_11]|nr:MAG: hypothetical protein A3B70_00860 [Deltaproteobacteria bacterium RIFCSPHIGHO2_02_FULL_40_11]
MAQLNNKTMIGWFLGIGLGVIVAVFFIVQSQNKGVYEKSVSGVEKYSMHQNRTVAKGDQKVGEEVLGSAVLVKRTYPLRLSDCKKNYIGNDEGAVKWHSCKVSFFEEPEGEYLIASSSPHSEIVYLYGYKFEIRNYTYPEPGQASVSIHAGYEIVNYISQEERFPTRTIFFKAAETILKMFSPQQENVYVRVQN